MIVIRSHEESDAEQCQGVPHVIANPRTEILKVLIAGRYSLTGDFLFLVGILLFQEVTVVEAMRAQGPKENCQKTGDCCQSKTESRRHCPAS